MGADKVPLFPRAAIEAHQNEGIGKEDRIIKKCLGQHEDEAKERSTAMFVRNRPPNFPPGGMGTCADTGGRFSMRSEAFRRDPSLELADNAFRFLTAPMNHEPARAFRNPLTKKNHDQSQDRAEAKAKRQPNDTGKKCGSRNQSVAPAPSAAPIQ